MQKKVLLNWRGCDACVPVFVHSCGGQEMAEKVRLQFSAKHKMDVHNVTSTSYG